MNHKSRVKGRAGFKVKTEETQVAPRCHIKYSREEVRIVGLQLVSSSEEWTVSMNSTVWLVWGKDRVLLWE